MDDAADFADLTAGEAAACRRYAQELKVPDSNSDDNAFTTSKIAVSAVPTIFWKLGFSASRELIVAIVEEHVAEGEKYIDIERVLQVVNEWKSMLRMRLRDTPNQVSPEEYKALTGRNLLAPDSIARTVWSTFVMLCGLVSWTIVLARDADEGWSREPYPTFVAIDWCLTVVYLVDLLLWLRTYRVVKEGIIDEPEEAAWAHMRSPWFAIDVASTVPLDVILSLAGASTASGVFSHLRLLRYPRSLLFFVHSPEFLLTPHRVVVFFQALPLWFLVYVFVGLVTTYGFCHAIVASGNGNTSTTYLQSVYFVVQTFTTVGYGDATLRPQSSGEMWFDIFLVYSGLLTNALGIGRLITQIQRDNAYTTREDKLRETFAVLRYFHIPQDLQTEILSFQEHVLWNDTANAYYGATSMLPQSMRDTMLLQTRIDVLSHVPNFNGAPYAVLYALGSSLISACYKPEEYISFSGDPHAGIRFVLFGFIARFDSRGQYECVLKSGEFFGFQGILTLGDEVYSHKALSYCDVWVLPPAKLHEVFDRFPKFFDRFKNEVPLDQTELELLRRGTLSSLKAAAEEGLIKGTDLRSLRQSLRHLRRRLEQTASKRGLKTTV
jgi:CRP-like cAMP-binding protein